VNRALLEEGTARATSAAVVAGVSEGCCCFPLYAAVVRRGVVVVVVGAVMIGAISAAGTAAAAITSSSTDGIGLPPARHPTIHRIPPNVHRFHLAVEARRLAVAEDSYFLLCTQVVQESSVLELERWAPVVIA